MTKNPILNALSALLYISGVASVMFYGTRLMGPGPDRSVIVPIAFISLFTLSAAVMGFIFLSQPVQFYLDGKKKEAVSLFLKTLASFGIITFIALSLLFSRILG